jgi:hypothetical protein
VDPRPAVERALPAFSQVRPGDWAGLRAALVRAGLPAGRASEVSAFMPIAFGRALMDGMGVTFSPEYGVADGSGSTRTVGRLADHPVYAAAEAKVAEMMESQEDGDALVGVALWSSEFSAVNQALNAGSNPADLEAGPPLLIPDADGEAPSPSGAKSEASGPAFAGPPGVASPRARPADGRSAGKPWWRFWG